MTKYISSILTALTTLWLNPALSLELEISKPIMYSLFSKSVVKIELYGNKQIFETDIRGIETNKCEKSGIGFFVSKSYVVSALHVVDLLHESCGPFQMKISRYDYKKGIERAIYGGDLILQKNSTYDIAVIKINNSSDFGGLEACSVPLGNNANYGSKGHRFLMDGKTMNVRLDDATVESEVDGASAPFQLFQGAKIEKGHSGGPILSPSDAGLIGVTRERYQEDNNMGVFIPVSILRTVLQALQIQPAGGEEICHELDVWSTNGKLTLKASTSTSDKMGKIWSNAGADSNTLALRTMGELAVLDPKIIGHSVDNGETEIVVEASGPSYEGFVRYKMDSILAGQEGEIKQLIDAKLPAGTFCKSTSGTLPSTCSLRSNLEKFPSVTDVGVGGGKTLVFGSQNSWMKSIFLESLYWDTQQEQELTFRNIEDLKKEIDKFTKNTGLSVRLVQLN
jgi:Trypsin